jgi:2-phospho-L-lactate guanylyltransferase
VSALLAHTEPIVIVPDRHGQGTNALLLSPPDVMTPAFGEGSFARHAALARAAGAAPRVVDVPSLGLDIDTADDLAALRRAPGIGPRTRALLEEAAVA